MRAFTMPVATIQYAADLLDPAANLARISTLVADAHARGARLIVFPELACTGYTEHTDLHRLAEGVDGTTVQTLQNLSRRYGVYLAAGFVEWHDGHVYNSISFTTPRGELSIYRKRHLIFWEHFYFRHGHDPLIVQTEFGRIGFAICADMMYSRVWSQYRGRIDLAIISAAWPCRTAQTSATVGWMLDPSWSLAAELPSQIARKLQINVVFSNQCGPCEVRIPQLGPTTPAAFAARSGIFDHQGRRLTEETESEGMFLGSASIPEERLTCVTLSA
ncbi:MAG: carbon-nitrogen hydrolase family protein [Planctomycetes bacterium]|nr:carbon-nitrogen hydrolase family protein [Planctomycetota bacterium]